MNNFKGITQRPSTWIVAAALVFGASFAANANSSNKSAGKMPLLKVNNTQFSPPAASQNNSGSDGLMSVKNLDQEFSDLTAQISPSVVHIRSSNEPTQGGSQGSGVIYRSDGWIVTNDHVVDGADQVTVILSNGREFKGKVTRGGDARNDIALVKIEATGLPSAPFAESQKVRPGQFAIAVGAPFGLENTVTIGHVSALGRNNAAGGMMGAERYYSNMIQTDASINPGNSGGPLLNINGEVIGINTSILSGGSAMSGGGGSIGVGFAIPSNQAKLVADTLISKGKLVRGYLGLFPQTIKPYEREEKKIDGGALVAELAPDGPAFKGGLRKNDIILSIGSQNVTNDQEVLNSMLKYGPGTVVDVEYLRGTQILSAKVKVGEFPKELARETIRQNRNGFDNAPNSQELRKRMEELQKNFGQGQGDGNFELGQPRNDGNSGETRTQKAPKGSPARLGVGIADRGDATASEFNVPKGAKGALITSVDPGSVGELVGLKAGDVITQIGNMKISNSEELVKAVKNFKVGDRTNITFSRFGKSSEATSMIALEF